MENDTKTIQEYLKEKNSKLIEDVSDKIVDPIKKISGTVATYMNPKDFVKNFSTITKLPLLQNIGSEIKDITKSLKEQLFQVKQESKNNFLLEAQKNKEISLKEENNDLLRKIEGKEFAGEEKKEEKKGIFNKVFGKTFGKIFAKLGATTIGGAVFNGLKKSKGLLSKKTIESNPIFNTLWICLILSTLFSQLAIKTAKSSICNFMSGCLINGS